MNNNWARGVIAMVDELRDAYTAAGLDDEHQIKFPRFVVVGSQSSGKSSVLERIAGHDFLPRGINTVTCRPIELRLHYVAKGDASRPKEVNDDEDWVVFGQKPTEIYTNFSDVHDEIQAQFDSVQKDKSIKIITSEPIILNIYTHTVANITLVDLPGLIAAPSDKQPKNLSEVVEKLVDSYIGDDNTLILAVCPANQDFTTTEALRRAEKFDPDRKRTLVVLTKIDLMDRGTDAVEILNGDKMRFNLGIVPVINRSHQDNREKLTSTECNEKEQEFFSKEPYTKFQKQSGIDYLCKTVNKVLVDKIKETLPREESAITKLIQEKEKDLNKLAKPLKAEDRKRILTEVIIKFDKRFCADIKGDEKISGTKKLNTGAQISLLYMELNETLNAIDPIDDLNEEEIHIAWANASGYESSLHVDDKTFAILMRNRIKRFEEPCMDILERVYDILKDYLDTCELLKEKRGQFPNMVREIEKIFMKFLDSQLEPTRKFIKRFISSELNFINRANVDFIGSSPIADKQRNIALAIRDTHINENLKAIKKSSLNSNEANQAPASNPGTGDSSAVQLTAPDFRRRKPIVKEQHTETENKKYGQHAVTALSAVAAMAPPHVQLGMKLGLDLLAAATTVDEDSEEAVAALKIQHYGSLIKCYFDIVRKKIVDSVPNFINDILINGILDENDGLQNMLNMNLYDESRLDELFQESGNIEKFRNETVNAIETLKKARETIEKVKMA